MNREASALFALEDSRAFGEKIADNLGVSLSPHEELNYDDGEYKIRPLESVRGKDVFVIQSLYAGVGRSIDDKLARLLFFIGSLKDASAERITAVVPYLAYSRLERQVDPRDPITSKYVALLFESVGVDRVVTMDVHSIAAFQNAFRCHTDHLETTNLFSDYFSSRLATQKVVVVSPDVGGIKRARKFCDHLSTKIGLEIEIAYVEKIRRQDRVAVSRVVGDVNGSTVVIFDDMISTGKTLSAAVKVCKESGASRVIAAATHGLFAGNAIQLLSTSDLSEVVITDTVAQDKSRSFGNAKQLAVIDSASLFAEAIKRIHFGRSVGGCSRPSMMEVYKNGVY